MSLASSALTSDEFFSTHDLREELGGSPVDLSFIDGLHLFEFALRDFINLERAGTEQSMIVLHDTDPPDADMAARESCTPGWTRRRVEAAAVPARGAAGATHHPGRPAARASPS